MSSYDQLVIIGSRQNRWDTNKCMKTHHTPTKYNATEEAQHKFNDGTPTNLLKVHTQHPLAGKPEMMTCAKESSLKRQGCPSPICISAFVTSDQALRMRSWFLTETTRNTKKPLKPSLNTQMRPKSGTHARALLCNLNSWSPRPSAILHHELPKCDVRCVSDVLCLVRHRLGCFCMVPVPTVLEIAASRTVRQQLCNPHVVPSL